MSVPIRLAVLLSGGGRSLQNLIDRIADGSLPARIEVVLSSRRGAAGLERAERHGLLARVVERREYENTDGFSRGVTEALEASSFDLIVLAGFMSLYLFPEKWSGKVINIHPGLLPEFGGEGMYGERVHRAVLKAGAKESGCTVHFADHVYDHGAVILQKRVPVLGDDTAETLAARVFQAECEAYPEAIRKIANDELRVAEQPPPAPRYS